MMNTGNLNLNLAMNWRLILKNALQILLGLQYDIQQPRKVVENIPCL